MGIGSMLFVMPQLISDRWSIELETINNTDSSTNICRNARVRDDTSERLTEYGFGTLPGECVAGEAALRGGASLCHEFVFFFLSR